MNRDELLQLYDMTFDEKVIMLFKMFPKKQSYIEEVIESFPLLHERGIKISSSFDFTYYIEIDTKGLCSFRKYWERDDNHSLINKNLKIFSLKDLGRVLCCIG